MAKNKMHPGAAASLFKPLGMEHVEGTRMGEYPVLWEGLCLGWFKAHGGTVNEKCFWWAGDYLGIIKRVQPLPEAKRDVLVWDIQHGTQLAAMMDWLKEKGRLAP